ncbi:hypothetical protein [Streptomyces sp. bgisy091]|uniref:hypothetical protein n=1 Tax=Streptomyces sp. bgisy091 TaxID=3413778 RepID=UPI003D74B483
MSEDARITKYRPGRSGAPTEDEDMYRSGTKSVDQDGISVPFGQGREIFGSIWWTDAAKGACLMHT